MTGRGEGFKLSLFLLCVFDSKTLNKVVIALRSSSFFAFFAPSAVQEVAFNFLFKSSEIDHF